MCKNTLFISLVLFLLGGLLGCSKDYSIKSFTKLTARPWDSLSQEEKKQYKNSWNSLDMDDKIYLFLFYGNSPEAKKEAGKIDYDSMPQEHIIECKKEFPWINLENPSDGDKLLLHEIGFSEEAMSR